MKADTPRITLIGCGNMGGALLKRWLDAGINATFTVINLSPVAFDVDYAASINEATNQIAAAALIVLAVKPQTIPEICATLKPLIAATTPLLSIAAGITINTLQTALHADQPVIRAMPNTPAQIGKGLTAALASPQITPETKTLTTQLFECAGSIEWIADESLFNPVTALSGSGPAYVFHLIEILEQAGIANGLPQPLAATLARQTVIGAASLAESRAGTSPQLLRENVTSPGGTTQAALKILMNGKMQELYNEALRAATARAEDLSKA